MHRMKVEKGDFVKGGLRHDREHILLEREIQLCTRGGEKRVAKARKVMASFIAG